MWRQTGKQKITFSLFLYLSQLFIIFSHLAVLSTSMCFCCVETRSDTLATSPLGKFFPVAAFTSDGNRRRNGLTVKEERLASMFEAVKML